MNNFEKADKILENLLNATYEESNKMIQKGYFSKDFVELCRNSSIISIWKVW